jgi:two-component sensor histidine kinase
MSVASLQKQLAVSRIGDVELRAYFTDLCGSIAASMISDHKQISLTATVDESSASSTVSVSLGLIATELVINALKHAFPGRNRSGAIAVDYRSDGSDWTLTVEDDGVGLPSGDARVAPGLGTGIVDALSKQLDATVVVTDLDPGTKVEIVHP